MLYKVRDELKAHTSSEIHLVRAEMEAIKADVHRMALLMEEQNNRNKIVLDGLAHIWGRQERLEGEFLNFKKSSS